MHRRQAERRSQGSRRLAGPSEQIVERLSSPLLDARAGGGVEPPSHPCVDLEGQRGVPRLVAGDALHRGSDYWIRSYLRLPACDKGSEGFAHAPFDGVLDGDVLQTANGARLDRGGRADGAVAACEGACHSRMLDLVASGPLGGAHQTLGSPMRDQLAAHVTERGNGGGFETGHLCEVRAEEGPACRVGFEQPSRAAPPDARPSAHTPNDAYIGKRASAVIRPAVRLARNLSGVIQHEPSVAQLDE